MYYYIREVFISFMQFSFLIWMKIGKGSQSRQKESSTHKDSVYHIALIGIA